MILFDSTDKKWESVCKLEWCGPLTVITSCAEFTGLVALGQLLLVLLVGKYELIHVSVLMILFDSAVLE